MAVSATAARVYINVPDALNLSQGALDATYAGIKGLNATSVRIPVAWKSVQPTSAQYFKWDATDLAVNRALAAGLRVLLVLSPPKPFWTATVTPTAFAAFAGAAAVRYKGKVAEYQVWDEPNVIANWPGTQGQRVPFDPAIGYAAVLQASHAAIKKADSAALVVFGGLRACATIRVGRGVVTAYEPAEFVSQIIGTVNPYFDVMAYHPLSVTIEQRPFPPAPSGDSIAGHDRLFSAMSTGNINVRRGRTSSPSSKKVYWTAVGYDLTQFTQTQQAYYLDTLRRLAQTRPEVTGLGVVSFRDYLV